MVSFSKHMARPSIIRLYKSTTRADGLQSCRSLMLSRGVPDRSKFMALLVGFDDLGQEFKALTLDRLVVDSIL
jgi:hypothetical protein